MSELKVSRTNNLLVFFLIALSGSVLHVGFFSITYVTAFLFATCVLIYKSNYIKKHLFLFLLALIFFWIIFVLNFLFSKSTDFKDYSVILMQILLSLLILLTLQVRAADFKYHIYRVLRFLILLSFIGFFLSAFKFGSRVALGDSGFVAYSLFYIFYYNASLNIGPLEFFRNQGIFWEPGLLAIYANIFLLLSLFVYKNKNNSILAVLCVLTTVSTTGIFMMLIQFLFFFKKRKFTFLQKIYLTVSLLMISSLVILSFTEKKLESQEANVSSYGLRAFDLYSGAMVAVSNPIFGIGLNSNVFITERNKFLTPEMDAIFGLIEERRNSNSLLALFYSLGLILSSLWLYFFYKQEIFKDQRLLFFLLAVIGFASEPLVFTPFFLCFVFSGFQSVINLKYD